MITLEEFIAKYKHQLDNEFHTEEHIQIYVGPYWLDVVDRAFSSMMSWRRFEANGKTIPVYGDFDFLQIKEKFGAIRVYVRPKERIEGKDSTPEQIQEYNKLSSTIDGIVFAIEGICKDRCENCGVESKVRSVKGWYTTMCEGCLVKNK